MKRNLRYIFLGLWLIASTKFTYDANQDDPALVIGWGTAITSSVLAFNLPVWLFISARDRKRIRRQNALGEYIAPDPELLKRKRIRKALVWVLVIALGYQVVQETNTQTALLSEAPPVSIGKTSSLTPSANSRNISSKVKNNSKATAPQLFEEIVPGPEDPYLSWTQVGAITGNPVIWKTCNPIKVYVNAGGSPYATEDVQFVIDYLNSLGTLTFEYAGTNEKEIATSGFKSDYTVQITYGPRESFSGDWNRKEAIAVGGSVIFNNVYTSGQIAAYLPAMDQASKQLREDIILHEFGHVLGLMHTTTVGDIMYPSASGEAKPTFNQTITDYFANNPGCIR